MSEPSRASCQRDTIYTAVSQASEVSHYFKNWQRIIFKELKGQHHDQFFEGLFFFFPSTKTSVLFTLSFRELLFNHMSLPDPESYLCNHTISKEKNCVVNCRAFDLLYPGTQKEAAHGSLHRKLEPEKQYADLLTLQS